MKRLSVMIILFSILLGGCTSSTPDPDLVARAVQATLTASVPTEAVTSEPTSVIKSTDIPADIPTATPVPSSTPIPTATPLPADTPIPTSTPAPTATETPAAPIAIIVKTVNLRSGPGTNYPVVKAALAGEQFVITGQSPDGTCLEICCLNGSAAWVAQWLVTEEGDTDSIEIAANIPTPPPSPTPQPTSPPSAPVQRPGMHTRIQIGSWEIQAERVQNEKAVYQYNSSKVAMGRYAIVFVLAKNLAPGTQSISSSLAPVLKDDKGRIYDYSDPLTTERMAMLYAMWEFSVGKTVFSDINPGVETPLLMLWDVNEDVQSLTLLLTDGRNRVEWDLGNFSDIPPYKP